MAISHSKKESLVSKASELFASTKGVAFATYQGISVAEIQGLRRKAREMNVEIKVFKNRLVRVAMSQSKTFEKTDTTALENQILYAFSAEDEVAAAKVLDDYAKTNPKLKLIGGFSAEGLAIAEADIKALASLPSKNQLVASVVAQLLSPVHDTTNALSGNLHALLDGIKAKASN